MTIPELLPLEAYESYPVGSPLQAALIFGVFFAVWDAVVSLLGGEHAPGIILTEMAGGLLAGLITGFIWFFAFRALMRRLLRRIYHGDPRIVPPAPAGSYDYRLAGNLMLSRSMSAGGHLYIGRETWTFVPHRRNLKRHQTPLSIPAAPPPAVEAVDVPLRGVTRILLKGLVRQVHVRTSSTTHRFVTPDPEAVAARLRDYLHAAS
ncbi:MAG TPA: hypothetical protein VFQ76_14125 [Longimicrobiaceae bacterium]|nr:hypothetical protein [Longimicrobiaceae bacterium]